MKAISSDEKIQLIRFHGYRLSQTMSGPMLISKVDVVESAKRIIELANSIRKSDWAQE